MSLFISKNIDELSEKAAAWIVEQIQSTLIKNDRFTIALSGGSTPKKLYQVLASDKFRDKVEWGKIHFYWGDERCVPFEDERNNARMAFVNLLDHVPVLKEHVHKIDSTLRPTPAAISYMNLLHRHFPNDSRSFDLVLLGLGADAHTLSLFPGSQYIFAKKNWVIPVNREEESFARISLTPLIINASASIAFLVSGKDKADAFRHARSKEYDPLHYPAQSIHPVNGELYWFVDEDAAGLIN